MADTPEITEAPWSAYPETVLYFAGEPEMMIDLREAVPPQTRSALIAIGLDEPFAILTSHDPYGRKSDPADNDRRFAELEAELKSSDIDYMVMDACSPDRSHCECSVAVKIPRQRALDIAKRWEQVAIFWWDNERFWIYGAIVEIEPPVSLP